MCSGAGSRRRRWFRCSGADRRTTHNDYDYPRRVRGSPGSWKAVPECSATASQNVRPTKKMRNPFLCLLPCFEAGHRGDRRDPHTLGRCNNLLLVPRVICALYSGCLSPSVRPSVCLTVCLGRIRREGL